MKCGGVLLKGNTAFAVALSTTQPARRDFYNSGELGRKKGQRVSSVRRARRHIKVYPVRMPFRPDRRFTGVAWFKGPKQRPAECRATNVHIPEGHSPPIGFLAHRCETAFVRIGAAADKSLFAGLAVKHGKRLGAAGGKQTEGKQRKAVHGMRLRTNDYWQCSTGGCWSRAADLSLR